MGLNTTNAAALLKTMYSKENLINATIRKSPLFAMVSKFTDFGGDGMKVPIIYGNPAARATAFATAQSQAANSSTKSKAFTVTHVTDYAVATITGSAVRRSKGDPQAFVRLAKTEIDNARDQLTQSVCQQLYGAGWGKVGTISASAALGTTTLLLSQPEDAQNFSLDDRIVFAAAEASGTLRTATVLTVTGVDRDAGTLTLSATPNSLASGIAVGDSIFKEEDRENAASPTRRRIAGVQAWIPLTAPSASESFFGVDRSSDPVRLAGARYTPSNLSPEDILIEATERVARNNYAVDAVFCNPTFMRNLIKSLGTAVRRDSTQITQKVSFPHVEIMGASGAIKVYSDVYCPANRLFGLNMDMWTLGSTGEAIRILDEDGNSMLRQSAADGYEVRLGFEGNLWCKGPVSNITVAV